MNEGAQSWPWELNNRTYLPDAQDRRRWGSEYAYLDQPDTQLNTWPEVSQINRLQHHYGVSICS